MQLKISIVHSDLFRNNLMHWYLVTYCEEMNLGQSGLNYSNKRLILDKS